MTPTNEIRRPTTRHGEELFCEDCKPEASRKIDDLKAHDCPCGARFDHGKGARKGARYIAR